jgi:hypothetical protein
MLAVSCHRARTAVRQPGLPVEFEGDSIKPRVRALDQEHVRFAGQALARNDAPRHKATAQQRAKMPPKIAATCKIFAEFEF